MGRGLLWDHMRRLWRAFLRFFFRLLYNRLAWSYDLVAWLVSLGHWRAWGRATLHHLTGQVILELGHGPGHLLVALEERDFRPVGVDLSPRMVRQAQSRLRNAGQPVPLVHARTQALPFRDLAFDTIVATFPTDFILDPATLHEVTRSMRGEGRLVVAVGARFEGEGLIATFLSWLYQVTGQNKWCLDDFGRRLAEVGLSTRIIPHNVDRTTVLMVVGEKRCRQASSGQSTG